MSAILFVLALSLPRPGAVVVMSQEAVWCLEYLAAREWREAWS